MEHYKEEWEERGKTSGDNTRKKKTPIPVRVTGYWVLMLVLVLVRSVGRSIEDRARTGARKESSKFHDPRR